MQKWFRKEHPDIFAKLRQREKHTAFFNSIEPWERHVPLPADSIARWKAELPFHGNSSYAEVLKRDIKLAEECNRVGDEMIISFKQTGA